MNKLLFFGLTVLMIGFTACTDGTTEEIPDNPADTLAQVDEVEGLEGIRQVNEKIKADPNNPNFYFERATLIMNAVRDGKSVSPNHYTLAKNDLKRALTVDSTLAPIHYELGNLNYQLGLSIEAMESYQKTIEYDETHTDAMVKIAQIFLVYKNYNEVIDYANKALKVDDYTPEAYFVKGWAYKELGDTFKAVSSFSTAREVNPEYYEADLQLALLYGEVNDPKAVQYYDAALSTQPESVEALYGRGLYHQNNGNFEKAIADYNKIIEIQPDYPLPHFNLGYIHLIYLEDNEKAAQHFSDAIAIVPDYYEALVNRGLAYENMERYTEARADYQKALDIKPDYDLAARGLSRLP